MEYESLSSVSEAALNDVVVLERTFSEIGFMTIICSPNNLTAIDFPSTYKGGKVGAKIENGNIEAGFVVYIDNKEINAIEGYDVRSEKWPENISEFSFYKISY